MRPLQVESVLHEPLAVLAVSQVQALDSIPAAYLSGVPHAFRQAAREARLPCVHPTSEVLLTLVRLATGYWHFRHNSVRCTDLTHSTDVEVGFLLNVFA